MEIIKSIEEVSNAKYPTQYSTYEGYKIVTDKQEIYVLISDKSSCCESYGHFANHDDLDYFIGSKLKNIGIVDECLTTKDYDLEQISSLDCGGTYFVNLETTKGTLQLTVYNSHNGYYGHNVIIKADQLPDKERSL